METTEARKAPKLRGADRFQAADFVIGRYAAKVPSGTTLEDVLHPQYFENHFDRMRTGMEIVVLSDDFALDARLRVLSMTKTTASMRVLDVHAGGSADVKAPGIGDDEIYVKYAGPNHKWRVMHGKTVVEFGFATEQDAEVARQVYLATIRE